MRPGRRPINCSSCWLDKAQSFKSSAAPQVALSAEVKLINSKSYLRPYCVWPVDGNAVQLFKRSAGSTLEQLHRIADHWPHAVWTKEELRVDEVNLRREGDLRCSAALEGCQASSCYSLQASYLAARGLQFGRGAVAHERADNAHILLAARLLQKVL